MALLLKGNALFLHIPKTGGSWVTTVLEEMGLVIGKIGVKHADIAHVMFADNSKTILKNRPFMFCFVRHPLSWYESWYKHMSQPSRRWCYWGSECEVEKWHPNMMLNGLGDDNFNRFVENVAHRRPGYATEMFGWFTTPPVNFVGRQENLRDDLITALELAKVEFDPEVIRKYPKVRVSPEPNNKIVWDADLKKQVTQLEYAGLVRYGYDTAYLQQWQCTAVLAAS